MLENCIRRFIFFVVMMSATLANAGTFEPYRFGVTQRFTYQRTHEGANLSTMPSWNPEYRLSEFLRVRGYLGATVVRSTLGDMLGAVAQVGFAYYHPNFQSIYPEALLGAEAWSKAEAGMYPAGSFNVHYRLRLGERGTFLGALDSATVGYSVILIPSKAAHHITVGLRFALWPESKTKAVAPTASIRTPAAATEPPSKERVEKETFIVEFRPNTDVMLSGSARMKAAVAQVAQMLKADADAVVEVRGHSDTSGDAAKNEALTEKRAQAIKYLLMRAGVEESRIDARGIGSKSPRASNTTAEGRARNRRAEMRVLSFSKSE